MVEFGWIKMSLFLMLLLQFTAVTEQFSSVIVRDGDDVTLPCENVTDGQDKCDGTDWIFSGSQNEVVDLFQRGQIDKVTRAQSDRLSLTANCSLVIKKVTVKDFGSYHCQQPKSEPYVQTQVYLSVININEHEDGEQATCSVLTHEQCRHTVKWRRQCQDVDEDMMTRQSECSVTVTVSKYHSELFTCEVTDGYTKKVHLFTFSPQSSGEDATTATTTLTMRTIENSKKSRTDVTTPANSDTPTTLQGWWLYIIVAIGLLALVIIIVVAVVRWKRAKGDKQQMDENVADPEDGVSYASISYTKKTKSKGRERVKDDDDEGDAVTYSTLKASSCSSAGSSTDPSELQHLRQQTKQIGGRST